MNNLKSLSIPYDLLKLNLYEHNDVAFSRLLDELEAPLIFTCYDC